MLLALPLWAQRRGGGSGAHMAAGGGFGGHPVGAFRGGSFHNGNFGHSSGIHLRARNPYRRRGVYGRTSYYPYYLYPYSYAYYPYLGDYGFYSDSPDDQAADNTYAESYNPPPSREDGGLERDVQTLSGKIDRLQSDVEAHNRTKPDPEPETALVFRDKHVEEVRNYAISGGNLWVLNEQAAKKIPLAQLDLDATVKMNDDRGVDFQVPEPALQIMIVR
jgi:hypothetical protein